MARLPELGINFIDTADCYGPFVSEDILAEVLSPYKRGLVIATKGGLTRHGPNIWLPVGRPEYLRQCVLMSLRRLKLERIDLWQLHRIDPKVPRDEQFGAIADMQREGLIRHARAERGLGRGHPGRGRFFKVVTVQNLYNLANRQSEAVLDHCEKNGIGFIPWFPLAGGPLAKEGGVLDTLAKKRGATPSQLALAWVLKRSRVMLPIPGTGKVKHLEENVAAAGQLTDEPIAELDGAADRA